MRVARGQGRGATPRMAIADRADDWCKLLPMCFDHDSHPPIAPIRGASIRTESLVLEPGDGARVGAYRATGSAPEGPAIVVLPDVRGLHRFYRELADRFAERGVDSIAVDYFARTAGITDRDNDFEYMPHVEQMTADGVRLDTAAAVEALRSSAPTRPVFVIGFCLGGSNAWQQAANGHDLAGVIGFYGHPGRARPPGAPAPVDRVGEMACPVLALMAGDDPGIPLDEVERFRTALEAAGVEHEVVVYDGAPHSFFDRKQETYADASSDAWERVVEFIGLR